MDIKHSLTYFRQQEGWKKVYMKLFACSFFCFIPIIGAFIYQIIFMGYMFNLTNSRIFKPEIPIAPWNTSKIFKAGLATFPYILFFVILNIMIKPHAQNPEALFKMIPTLLIISLILGVFIDLSLLVFMTNLKFKSMLKFNAMKFIFIDNFIEYVKFSLIKFFIAFVYGIIFILSAITIIGPMLLTPAIVFIAADLNAQFLRKIFKINTNPTQG
jgi:hypothetical protein